ncbi:hypothetical protein BKA70DRAFT_1224206 [Coprinopsis sp. MPI-PUGE-AT-0042]|nr:hypothetical protein BKA70DRAFT_1224206 [Coprinopsis sp. MPI-PUGE-AT-0042]
MDPADMQNHESEPIFTSRVTGQPVPCPSDYWLKSPAWIDGASNPPRHYYTREEMDEAVAFWGPRRGIFPSEREYLLDQAMARVSPSPVSLTDATRAMAQIPGPPLPPSVIASAPPGPVVVGIPAHETNLPANDPSILAELASQLSDGEAPEDLHVVRAIFTSPVAPAPGVKSAKKFTSTTKIFTINISKTARKQLVNAAFLSHSLSHAFKAGDVSGPAFRMHWTGSAGGKTNAASILTDDEFDANKAALLRKPKKPEVSIEIFSTDLEPFRIQEVAAQLASLPGNGDDSVELMYGTKVPQVTSFSTQSQLHGLHIMELKQKYKCEKHLGEHGEAGHCFVSPAGDHIRLNLFRLRIWAAAWASGDATKHEPPNVDGFDGARNGENGPRPRGRNGPRAPPLAAPTASGSNEMMALLVGALLPNLGNLGRKHGRDESVSPRKYRTPPRLRALTSDSAQAAISSASSILPPSSPLFPFSTSPEADIQDFLESLQVREGIDFTASQSTLAELDLTPDILPHADTSLLVDLLGSTIGKVLKLKLYAESWSLRRNGKKPEAPL